MTTLVLSDPVDPSLLTDNPVRIIIMGRRATGTSFASRFLTGTYDGKAWTIAERIKQISHALIDQSGSLGDLLDVVILDKDLQTEAARQLLLYADTYEREPGLKPIRLYQDVGEILRHLDASTLYCWEQDLERRILANPAPLTAIDVRAKESHHYFADQRGYASLLMTASQDVRERRMRDRDQHVITDPAAVNHVSETDVDHLDFDFVIDNDDDDPARLHAQLNGIVRQLVTTGKPFAASAPVHNEELT